MVLIERLVSPIPEVEVGTEKPYQFIPPLSLKREQVLKDEEQNTTVGLISQMAMLTGYANDLFAGLIEQTTQTCQRISGLSQRVNELQSLVPIAEKKMETPLSQLLKNPREELSLMPTADAQLFMRDSCPKSIKDKYKVSSEPPALYIMDPYMDDGKKCVELYTNPRFFLDEWIAEQLKQRQLAKEERRKRREERKLKKEQEGSSKQKMGAKKPTKMDRIVYDPHTGEKTVIKADEDPSTYQQVRTQHIPVTTQVEPQENSYFDQAPPPPSFDSLTPPNSQPQMKDISLPPPAEEFIPPPTESFSTQIATSTTEVNTSATMPPPPPPPVAPTAPAAPVPPPPTPPLPAAGPGALLSAIQAGANLKSVSQNAPPPKKADAHSDLMTAIRSGKALRTATTAAPVEKKPASNVSQSVAEILSRRIAIAPSDSEEEDDSDDENSWS